MSKSDKRVYNSPDYKALTKAEQAVFRNVAEVLTERGTFNQVDAPVIAAYARNVILARKAAEDIEKLGTVVEFQDRGYRKYKQNPAVTTMAQAQKAYETTAIKLGLTPTGRKNLRAEEQAASKWSALKEWRSAGDDEESDHEKGAENCVRRSGDK